MYSSIILIILMQLYILIKSESLHYFLSIQWIATFKAACHNIHAKYHKSFESIFKTKIL
jgi:hypothetical protein